MYTSYSLVDSFNDPILGYLADRSTRFTEKYGKRFPWIMLGFLIGPILLILCFVPVSVIQVDTAGNVLNWDSKHLASFPCIIPLRGIFNLKTFL
ncbi:MAG: MFS transporter [Candidatus Hermodarchaeota archaeon]